MYTYIRADATCSRRRAPRRSQTFSRNAASGLPRTPPALRRKGGKKQKNKKYKKKAPLGSKRCAAKRLRRACLSARGRAASCIVRRHAEPLSGLKVLVN